MVEQLLIGSFVICITVVIHVLFTNVLVHTLNKYGGWIATSPLMLKRTTVLIGMVLWLVAGLTVSTWVWAGVFIYNGVFEQLETALYFSVVTFTTLGFGDVIVGTDWRLLSSLAAVNGLVIIGFNTAFLIEALSRIHKAQTGNA